VASAYEAHQPEIYAFLVRSTRNPAIAEELLQETFLRLTEETRSKRPPEQVRPWLYRVASNLVISRGRRNSAAQRWLERVGREPSDMAGQESAETRVLRRERTGALEQALTRLAPDARVAMVLSSEGFSGEEIAATIGRTHAATRTLLTRARIQLRNDLAAEVAS
jgi:RNA polymerase sigma-70 factor (ECF subfamily)